MVVAEPIQYVKPTPRDYQVAAAEAWLRGGPASIVQLPTGAGKTVTCGLAFDRFDGTCLFLAHTDELVRQTCRTMMRMGLWPKVEKSDEYRGIEYLPDRREWETMFPAGRPPNSWFRFDKVWVSSMQTFVGRVEKYAQHGTMTRPRVGFDAICIDEAHRVRCRTYETILAKLFVYNPAMKVLLLTATPYRADKKSLGTVAADFAYRMTILDAIDDGWLVDIRGKQVQMRADTSKWELGKSSHGRDITDASLRSSMMSQDCIESIVHPILEQGEDRKGIVFLPGIETAEAIAAALNELKPGIATYVHGKVSHKDRRRRIRSFEDGKYKILTGANVFVEGFDVPDISLVVMARPTQSRGRYEQALGRGLRPLASYIAGKHTADERKEAIASSPKRDCLVLDFANTSRFKLVSAVDVVLSDADEAKREYVRKNLENTEDRRSIREQLDEIESLYDLREALRVNGGPPPRQDYTVTDVNLYGGTSSAFKEEPPKDAKRPSMDLLMKAVDMLIPEERAERMTSKELKAAIEKQKERITGKKMFGHLMRHGINVKQHKINYHEGVHLQRLIYANKGNCPANWMDSLTRFRNAKK